MRGLRFSIFLWFVTIVAVLCLKLPTVEVEEPSPVVEVVEVVTPESEPEVTPQPWTDEEVIVLAKMLWGEARGVSYDAEKAACVWCALNRVDHGYGDIWYAEREGQVEVGRVLPADYLWFSGDGKRNHFRNAYRGGDRWDWSLPSPYES